MEIVKEPVTAESVGEDFTAVFDRDSECNLELWPALVGPQASLPKKGDVVVYFPQGHLEYAAWFPSLRPFSSIEALTSDLQPQIICRVVHVQLIDKVVAHDFHGTEWIFKLNVEDEQMKYSVTRGWNEFLRDKHLFPGDTLVFLRGEDRELRVSFADFLIPYEKRMKSITTTWHIGGNFQMQYKFDDSLQRCNGVVIGMSDLDPNKWPNSKWRCIMARLSKSLEIDGCSTLLSLPIDKLPTTLRHLKMVNCMNLKSLDIKNCDSVGFGQVIDSNLVNMKSTSTLQIRHLVICDCPELEDLHEDLHNLDHLKLMLVSNCSSLVSFPEGGLPNNSLIALLIYECESLKFLPNQLHKVNSLQFLNISDCHSIMSFPEGGLPPNLV
ncbi:hypothetical protein QYF36_016691 [Acer negundo]|nr:hypothetical protein QYF36_016691 [Acer negundo]